MLKHRFKTYQVKQIGSFGDNGIKMARAYRHFISGYAWHLTHRCHKREFLLKFAKDKQPYLWLCRLSIYPSRTTL